MDFKVTSQIDSARHSSVDEDEESVLRRADVFGKFRQGAGCYVDERPRCLQSDFNISVIGGQPVRCIPRYLHSGIVAHCISFGDVLCVGGAVTYSDAMARIIVTAPQLMSVVNEELPGHEVVGGDHFMDRQELSRQIATADAILTSLSDPLDAEMIGQGKNLKVIGQCAAGFNNIDLDAAQQAGVVVTSTPGVLHEATADAILTSLSDPLDAEMIGQGKNLKVIGQCAAGFNNIDLDAAQQAGVVVTSTPGVLHEATADLAFTLLLEVTRRTGEAERWVRAGRAWRYDHTFMLGAGLQGATLGIVGLGQIGEAMARRGAAFGMNVIYNARHEKDVAAIDAVNLNTQPTRRVELDELFATSDVVSLHCPLTDETRHLVDADALAAMKKTAYLVNTARGACVDEAALVEALKTGAIAGVGLDVFEEEPTITADLLTMENVVLLPHLGSAALPTREAMSRLAARNIAKVLDGKPAETPVE